MQGIHAAYVGLTSNPFYTLNREIGGVQSSRFFAALERLRATVH